MYFLATQIFPLLTRQGRRRPGASFVSPLVLLCGLIGPVSVLQAAGSDLFQAQCASCHALVENTSVTVGPALIDIIDQPAAQRTQFDYSGGLLDKAREGLVWDRKTLNQFLMSPAQVVPGTKMNFEGLKNESERAALIAWLADADAMAEAAANNEAPTPSPEVEKILALAADPDYGEYLAAECATCHGNTTSAGVPSIKGLPKHYFVQSLLDYKSGVRDNSVMKLMAANLGDDELAALAAFFAQTD